MEAQRRGGKPNEGWLRIEFFASKIAVALKISVALMPPDA
jgi:hypothetical protein